MHQQNHYIYQFGPFHLDAIRRVLLKDGQQVKLFPKEFDTLLVLVESQGELLEKTDLMQRVWQETIVEESNLTTNIYHLRKVLGETRDRHDYIVTVPGRGYRFVAGVRQGFSEVIVRERTRVTVEEDETNGNFTPSHAAAVSVRPLPLNNRRALLLAGATVLVTVSFSAFFALRFKHVTSSSGPFQNVALKQLTTNSRSHLAALSPDGQLFVYVSRDRGQESLSLGHVGGSEPVILRGPAEVTYRSLNFSPDGGNLYYVAVSDEYPRGVLFRMPALGGVPEKLHDDVGVRVAFSPDMEQFAYARHDAGKNVSSLMIAETHGSTQRVHVSRPGDRPFRSASVSWSRDGSTLAVGAVTEENGQSSELFVVPVAGGQIKPLTALYWNNIYSTVWLPDGHSLAIVAKEKGAWDNVQLWHISYPDGVARRILSDLNNYGSTVSLSSDGQLLLTTQEQRINNVWVGPATDLSQARQITFSSIGRRDGIGGLDWTPDAQLVFSAIINESLTIWTMGTDGNHQKQLSSAGHLDRYPSLPSDGRYIVFESNRSGDTEIWRTRKDGGDMKQLTKGGRNARPHVSPDGRWVVYESSREGLRTIWRVSIDSGDPVRLASRTASWPQVSPDGKLIACEYQSQLDPPLTQLALIPIEGGGTVKLFDIPRLANFTLGARWMPDGRAVTYRDWANGIWRQPLSGGKPERLKGLPEEKLYAYAWSRDGKQFAFVRGAEELRDVVLVRDIK